MKKTLLLSVVASTMIMAGGDIAPVEPVVAAPSVAAPSGWDLSGQMAAYTQTVDRHGQGELFSGQTTYGALGLQLKASNKDIFAGFGAGVEVSAIKQTEMFSAIPRGFTARGVGGMAPQGSLNNSFSFPFWRGGDAQVESAAITQAYLTYGLGNTSVKVGRQTLPMSLSPFAFSEGWQMFKNTMEAALVVNTDLPDTTLVYAAIGRANSSIGRLDNFEDIAQGGPIHLVTAQNKSISGLTLTGSYYFAPEMDHSNNNNWGGGADRDMNIFWGDAGYSFSDYFIGVQGGQLSADNVASTNAFGVKLASNLGFAKLSAAFSHVNDGAIRVSNLATIQNPMPHMGIKSPLYTQMVLNNIGYHQALNSDWLKLAASSKVLGGTATLAYGMAMDNNTPEAGRAPSAFGPNPYEVDVIYKTKLGKDITLFGAYVLTNRDRATMDSAAIGEEQSNNFVRFWARYDF